MTNYQKQALLSAIEHARKDLWHPTCVSLGEYFKQNAVTHKNRAKIWEFVKWNIYGWYESLDILEPHEKENRNRFVTEPFFVHSAIRRKLEITSEHVMHGNVRIYREKWLNYLKERAEEQ